MKQLIFLSMMILLQMNHWSLTNIGILTKVFKGSPKKYAKSTIIFNNILIKSVTVWDTG